MISRKLASSILNKAELPEGSATGYWKYAAAPKETRYELIRRKPESQEAKICAAIEIQRVFRGYCSRCGLLSIIEPKLSQAAVYAGSKQEINRIEDFKSPSPVKRIEKDGQFYKTFMKKIGRPSVSIKEEEQEEETGVDVFMEYCATCIQRWWRRVRGRYRRKPRRGRLSYGRTSTQTSVKKRTKPLENQEAAIIIQRAWRRHIDVQVYRYYRDLINFRNHGDPSMMMRCINPIESKMLDAASGVHVKFRLAGDRFPPNIYYKIFTHRPIQDLCANAPRDYTKFSSKLRMARDVHNKGDRIPNEEKLDWYQRVENNGWRLVSDRIISNAMNDPITWATANKKIDFHHVKTKRRQDVEKKKKMKKIDWMKKMYKEGMLRAKTDDEETIELIEGAATGMVATIETRGPEAVHDWEVDELLQWTTSLNYEDYQNGWSEMATSAPSEKQIYERFKLFTTTTSDPYELSLSQGSPTKPEGSARQSHNTPVSSQSVASY